MTQWLPFGEALAVAQSLGLASREEWKAWSKEGKRPPNVPSHPDGTYKDGGWQGWGHWLGTGNQSNSAKEFLPFDEALAVAQSPHLSGRTEWRVWCKQGACPSNVPANPNVVYKGGGWRGWGHWLGTGPAESAGPAESGTPAARAGFGAKEFLPFAAALAAVRPFRLANRDEWRAWCKTSLRPIGVPTMPDRVYKDSGWQNLAHWLGTAASPPPPDTEEPLSLHAAKRHRT